jgi:hypothetical protein
MSARRVKLANTPPQVLLSARTACLEKLHLRRQLRTVRIAGQDTMLQELKKLNVWNVLQAQPLSQDRQFATIVHLENITTGTAALLTCKTLGSVAKLMARLLWHQHQFAKKLLWLRKCSLQKKFIKLPTHMVVSFTLTTIISTGKQLRLELAQSWKSVCVWTARLWQAHQCSGRLFAPTAPQARHHTQRAQV